MWWLYKRKLWKPGKLHVIEKKKKLFKINLTSQRQKQFDKEDDTSVTREIRTSRVFNFVLRYT